jgi:ATP-binding cassette subfamily B protein/ATP-binding cassette subfamily B multidrug efflux pump
MPVMTTPPTIIDGPDAAEPTVNHGEIRFENVHFAYKTGKLVTDGLSLRVRPGEKVGLVGLSGAGRRRWLACCCASTTYATARLIDRQDIRAVAQASLRRAIGVIAQDVSLLHRSVGDNIRYGRPEATQDEIEQAAKTARADAFIADLADGEGRKGFDAFVGDRGIKLSGGQRQPIAIARVLLKNAPILVLDELRHSTANLRQPSRKNSIW